MPLVRGAPPTPAEPLSAGSAADLLRTGNPDERWSAARALSLSADGIPVLGHALTTETEPRVREAIFTSLVRLGGRGSVEAVVAHLRTDDANLRMGALDALRAMIGDAGPVLPALLSDPDADIRVICCDLVRELPAANATSLLCGVLENDPEPNVCAAAVDVLAEIGEPDALPCLEACAARFGDETFLAFAVRIAMERIAAERRDRHG